MLKRVLCLLFAVLFAAAAAACQPSTPAETGSVQSGQGDPSGPLASRPGEDGAEVWLCDGVQVPVPRQFVDRLIIETPGTTDEGGHVKTLFTCRERASVEGARIDYPDADGGFGFLFGLCKIDPAGIDETDIPGGLFFAKDTDGNAYLLDYPTDVQFYRAGMENFDPESKDFADWSELVDWTNMMAEELLDANPALSPWPQNAD